MALVDLGPVDSPPTVLCNFGDLFLVLCASFEFVLLPLPFSVPKFLVARCVVVRFLTKMRMVVLGRMCIFLFVVGLEVFPFPLPRRLIAIVLLGSVHCLDCAWFLVFAR